MTKDEVSEALRAVVATNLALQNSLGTYAAQSAKVIQLLEGDKHSLNHLWRVERDIKEIGELLNTLLNRRFALVRPPRSAKRIKKKKK